MAKATIPKPSTGKGKVEEHIVLLLQHQQATLSAILNLLVDIKAEITSTDRDAVARHVNAIKHESGDLATQFAEKFEKTINLADGHTGQ